MRVHRLDTIDVARMVALSRTVLVHASLSVQLHSHHADVFGHARPTSVDLVLDDDDLLTAGRPVS